MVDGHRFSNQSKFLTKALDALPFFSTTTPSTIDVEAEIARLIPGHSKVIDKSGNAYIDDFEGTKTTIDLKARQAWTLASTPQHQNTFFPEGNLINQLEYGFNRAKLAFYIIDRFSSEILLNHPDIFGKIRFTVNHFVREVFEKEIFPAKESPVGQPTNIFLFSMLPIIPKNAFDHIITTPYP